MQWCGKRNILSFWAMKCFHGNFPYFCWSINSKVWRIWKLKDSHGLTRRPKQKTEVIGLWLILLVLDFRHWLIEWLIDWLIEHVQTFMEYHQYLCYDRCSRVGTPDLWFQLHSRFILLPAYESEVYVSEMAKTLIWFHAVLYVTGCCNTTAWPCRQ